MGHSPRLADADPVGMSRQARTKISDTLVEILGDTASDAGSTPAASTKLNLDWSSPSIRDRMDAYSASAWAPAFTAIAGSSAALTGLLFVAISINLSQILKVPLLVPRAMEVLVLLTAVLVLSTLLLMPGMTATGLGVEVLSIALTAEGLVTVIQVRSAHGLTDVVTPGGFAVLVLGGQGGLILLLVGGVSLLAQGGGGLYWVVPGMAFAMVSAIIGAWVLLVEILR